MQTHSLGSLAAAGRDLGAALHSSCKAPRTSEANHRLSRNFVSPLPQRPLRVLCGDWVIQGIWVKTLTLLQSWACVHGYMIRVIHLLPSFSLQKKGICRSASCDQGCQKASLDEAGCVDTLYLFNNTTGKKQGVCVQPECSHPQLTHHTCARHGCAPKPSWERPDQRDWEQGQYNCFGSQIFQSAGTAAAQHFQSCSPLHW